MRVLCLLVASTALVLGGCAFTTETRAEEIAWLALHTIDTAQTANISRTPGVEEYESAWIIGREPSRRSVYAYMGGIAALHVGIAAFMDTHEFPRWERRLFEVLTLADASTCVIGNYRIGLAAHF